LQNTDGKDSQSNLGLEGIVDCAAAGDTEAFGCLYDVYADRIYRYIYYRTSSIEDARDLTQDVFIEVWRALPRYKRTKTPFLGWLFTICRHTVIDYYRTKKDHAYLNDEILIEDRDKTPEKLAEDQFTQQEVRRAILQLTEEQQQVIIMSFIEGFSYNEIAEALNRSEGNIRVIVHRALKKMREILGRVGN
jgi:RNA polymerase sigma-70 factor (ECF subfamily)